MKAADAIRLRFVHSSADAAGAEPPDSCQGMMTSGERCEENATSPFYGFYFCGRHRTKVSKWVGALVFDDKEPPPPGGIVNVDPDACPDCGRKRGPGGGKRCAECAELFQQEARDADEGR